MKRHPDQIAREKHLDNKKRADNMKSCWVQSQEKIRVYDNGMIETQDGAVSWNGSMEKRHENGIVETVYTPPPYPVYTSTPTPMYENFPKLLVKKLDPKAIIPTKANNTDAGYDLHALNVTIINNHSHKLIKTGISMAIPEGYVGLIWPRSGLAYKYGLDVFAGVIDSGYRGDIGIILFNSQYGSYHIEAGDRIAQILIQKIEDFELLEVDDLDKTERDKGGFGSSGK
jgi:dUTP pyrophosphatase